MRFFTTIAFAVLIISNAIAAVLHTDVPLSGIFLTTRYDNGTEISIDLLNTELADVPSSGVFLTTHYDNGTEVSINLLNPELAPLVAHNGDALSPPLPGSDASSSNVSKRGNSCWGYLLERTSCDNAVWNLRDYLNAQGNGVYLESQGNSRAYVHSWVGSSRVYLCVNAYDAVWRVYYRDLDRGLYEMDHSCRLYEAGYFFNEPATFRIVGKADVNQAICLG